MAAPFTPPTVVVGVDGSPAATRAAVWAVDEAISRDVPLRLVGIAEPLDVAGEPAALAGQPAAVHSELEDGRHPGRWFDGGLLRCLLA